MEIYFKMRSHVACADEVNRYHVLGWSAEGNAARGLARMSLQAALIVDEMGRKRQTHDRSTQRHQQIPCQPYRGLSLSTPNWKMCICRIDLL